MKKITLLCCTLFSLALCAYSQVKTATIRISRPLSGSHVPQDGNTIEFSTSLHLALGFKPVVFVKDPIGGYWPYLGADQDQNDINRWTIQNVQFGNGDDSGRRFEVRVIALSDRLLENGFPYHGKTIYIENNTPLTLGMIVSLSHRATMSQLVTVIRD